MCDRRALVAGEIVVNSEAFKNLTALCDRFGSRFFATHEEKAAAEFLATKLSQYGLRNIRIEPYTLFGWKDGELAKLWHWRRGTASLELLEPKVQRLSCLSLANAPSTPDVGVTAEIFNLERGSLDYLLQHQEEIKGKLVLDGNYLAPGAYLGPWDSTNLFRTTLYGYLMEFGAAGLICTNSSYGSLPKAGNATWGFIGEMPACGITREDSKFILRQMSKGKTIAKLRLKNKYWPGAVSYNVIADLPGYKYPEKVVLVGSHYDCFDFSVGAIDDAAGACVVLEAARALAIQAGRLKRTVRFCLFSGEELGLNGSTGYVLNHVDELKNIELMINADAAGVSAKTGHGFVVCGPNELTGYLEKVSSELGAFDRGWELPRVTQFIMPYSDHWPFYMLGVPAAHFYDLPMDPIDLLYCHTPADTVDKVDVKGIKDAAIILALALMHIADEKEIPVKHAHIEEIVKILEEEGIAENLRVEKRWRREVPH